MPEAELLDELLSVIAVGLPCVYCTIVATRGSTPQKAGATMLVYADGKQSGTLGGGCVEAEVRRRALQSFVNGGAASTFHTFTLDDDYGWDDGLICGGRMTILADPLDSAAGDYFTKMRLLAQAGTGHTEVVALPENRAGLPAGARYLLDGEGRVFAARRADLSSPSPLEGEGRIERSEKRGEGFALKEETPHPVPKRDDPLPQGERVTGNTIPSVQRGLVILPTAARIRLLIVGAGHVGQAVAKLAGEVGFEIWVLDDRESLVSVERFPTAARRIAGSIGDTLQSLGAGVTPSTYCVIVTRGHNHDEEALFHLAPTPAGYVGMIGSKRKVKLIFDDLRAKGISEEALARVRAPIGLDIGSQTVPEIAVSIVAELIARRSGAG